MDSYLEASGLWEGFHGMLVPGCTGSLNRQLPEPYVAHLQTRIELVSLEEPTLQRLPDVLVGRRDNEPPPRKGAGAAEVATIAASTIPLAKPEVEVRERWGEIFHLPDMELVTAIEILSPINKG
jgi:hypothetical protein